MEIGLSIDGVLGHRHDSDEGAAVCMHELIDILGDYRPHIFRFLLASFGDPDLAKALTQRCVETIFSKWNEDLEQSDVRKLLMRMAVRLERRYWWKQRLCFWQKTDARAAGLAHLNDWLPDNQQTGEDQVRTKAQIKRIWDGVCRLGNRQKIVFLLYCVEDMTSREIAEIADLHEWTVEGLLAGALIRIRATIHEGADSS